MSAVIVDLAERRRSRHAAPGAPGEPETLRQFLPRCAATAADLAESGDFDRAEGLMRMGINDIGHLRKKAQRREERIRRRLEKAKTSPPRGRGGKRSGG